jgi:hypothetical protein
VSVCGTVILCAPCEVFLVSVESLKFSLNDFPRGASALTVSGFACSPA